MRYIMLMIMLSCIGCDKIDGFINKPYKNYKVNGELVQCRMELMTNCGISLWDCSNGMRYSCLTNLQWLDK